MKRFSMVIFLLALLAHSSQSLRAQTITLRLGHVGFPGSLFAITTDEYAKRANAALAGKVEIKVFHSSQLGSDEQMMRGIKVGAPEMFLPSTVMSTAEQKFGVFEQRDGLGLRQLTEDLAQAFLRLAGHACAEPCRSSRGERTGGL